MIIDIHNHLPPKSSPYRLPAEEYLSVMDEAGVDKAIILGKDYGVLGDKTDANLSDEDAEGFVKAHPDRFIAFTAVHPDRPSKVNVDRIDHAVNELGFKGIKINPPSGFYPNDERLYPSYEKAQELKIPVVFHMGLKPPAEGCRLKYCRPTFVDDVVVDFPNLPIIIAHAGYPWVDETIMVGLYAENVYVDISTLNQVEEAMGEPVILPTLKKLHASLGSRKIVYGSDGIFNIEPIKEAVNSADFLSANDKENIFWKNSKELLKL
jgi:hypothetical protein